MAEKPTLSNINLGMPIGSLVAVVGSTREGKTSLISAMLGELPPIAETSVIIRGSVAYVPQVSWIFNATVRDNILFGSPFQPAHYEKAVEVTALEHDLEILPMHGNSFQRKLAIVKNGVAPTLDKPKRRTPVSYGGRSSVPDKLSQRSRSMSFSPDRVRVRGRSPAFNALAANFESPNARNLSTPPPVLRKLYLKSVTPDSTNIAAAPRSAAVAALTA